MLWRESMMLQNGPAGIAVSTGLDSRARYLVLLVAVVLFLLTLSGEMAYRPEFRLTVIAVGILLAVLVGPRQEVFLVRSERKAHVTRRFFLFSRSREYPLDDTAEAVLEGRELVLRTGGQRILLARIRRVEDGARWLAAVGSFLAGMTAREASAQD